MSPTNSHFVVRPLVLIYISDQCRAMRFLIQAQYYILDWFIIAGTVNEEDAHPGHWIPNFHRRLSTVVGFLLHLPEVPNLIQSYFSTFSVMFDLP